MIRSKNDNQPINILLEKYVFEVAARFIDLATPDDQTRLINLINSIEKSSQIKNSPGESAQEMGTNHHMNPQ